ncbi:MAG: hypothetical protein ACT4QE_15705 [Anaerolineales bacterium]
MNKLCDLRFGHLSVMSASHYLGRSIWMAGLILLLSACASSNPEQFPVCQLESLIISVDDLPGKASLIATVQPVPDSTTDSIAKTFSVADSISVGQAIFWYPSTEYSKRKYDEELGFVTIRDVSGRDFMPPSEVNLSGLTADDYALGCGKLIGGYTCIFVARYEGYVVWLNSQIDGQSMSLTKYAQIISRLDDALGDCVSK